jgi:trk system potassium uptake protein TrkH
MLYLHWSLESGSKRRVLFAVAGLILLAASWFAFGVEKVTWSALSVAVGLLLAFPRRKGPFEKIEHGWEVFVIHPARLLLTSFLALCVLGTLMLVLPVSTCEGVIEPIDAVFTAVSAVCVTGLIVLDTPNDFTLFGQLCVLILIQLGGLGIMSLATVALHAMGRRLSLRQERLLSSITDTGRRDLVHALKMILKFTFVAESVGAVLLVFLFHDAGDSFRHALWRGVFTAVSAFCNAGFALQSDSLIPYRENVFIIHTVSTLIIFGGMAPATSLLLPRWISGKPIPTPAWIALGTTGILLVSGTLFILAFEWNGVLSGLAPFEKIQNAWFQSATLRTAGFNSLDIAGIAGPTFFVMIAFMFIGGSPGGTAGGVKTTTIGILAMTFWANITNHSDVVTHNRRIHPFTVYRAITIVVAGMAVWFVAVLMLQVTQQVSTRDLVFEATSALGTVGLSTGATSLLDEIGKIIIIITMFVGRIGPMTLFMLLSDSNAAKASRCIEEKISLT